MRGKNNQLIQLIAELPNNITMAEVGCYAGESTLMFLRSGKIQKLYAIDPWNSQYEGKIIGDVETLTRIHKMYADMQWAERSFDTRVLPYKDIVVKMKMIFDLAFFRLPELNFIYIDGDHRYERVLEDITTAKKIVKEGGIIAGHDYCQESPGVIKAVNEIFGKPDKTYPDLSWMVKI